MSFFRRQHSSVPALHWTRHHGDSRVFLRYPVARDAAAFTALMQRSRELHYPWIQPPVTAAGYRRYLERMGRADHFGFLVCERASESIVGVINLNHVVYGAFLSASLGYYAGIDHAGQGLMREGLAQVITVAFRQLGLHRLEANIQPGNEPSTALVRSLGFRHEGFSPAYLYIDGGWRDHERWALVDDRDALLPAGIPISISRQLP